MMPWTCCFCSHPNPERAKFCNECASPLHLKPCDACDAVNTRDATACHRCGAPLPEIAAAAPAERIVAEADATLATLKRELVGTTAAPAPTVETAGMAATAAIAPAAAPIAATAGTASTEATLDGPPILVAEPSLAPLAEPAVRAMPGEGVAAPPQPSPIVLPEDRAWRPERRSRGYGVAALAALVLLPLAVYVMRNPSQLDVWLGREAGPPAADAPGGSAATAPAPAPDPPPVPLPPAQLSTTPPVEAPTAARGDPPAALAPPQEAVAGEQPRPASPPAGVAPQADVAPPADAAPRAEVAPPAPSVREPAPVAAPVPDRQAKAPAKATGSAKSRPRERTTGERTTGERTTGERTTGERTTKPRPQPTAPQRRSAQPAAAEPCTEAVAALGLCVR